MRARLSLHRFDVVIAFLVALLLLIAIPARAQAPATAPAASAETPVPVDTFLNAVTGYMNATQVRGFAATYLSIGDPDKLTTGARGWYRGIVVNPTWLNNYQATEGKGSLDGLTVPDGHKEYVRFTILRQTVVADPQSAFHECIHAYHFANNLDDDVDSKGGAETASNNFVSLAGRSAILDRIVTQIEADYAAKRDPQDKIDKLHSFEKDIQTEFDGYGASVKKCIENIGGKTDFPGLFAALDQRIDRAKNAAGAPTTGTSTPGTGSTGATPRTTLKFDVKPGGWLHTGIQLAANQSVDVSVKGTIRKTGPEPRTIGPDGYYWLGFQAWTFKAKVNDQLITIGAGGPAWAKTGGELLLGTSYTYEPGADDSKLEGSYAVEVSGEGIKSATPPTFAAAGGGTGGANGGAGATGAIAGSNAAVAIEIACPVTVSVKDDQGRTDAMDASGKVNIGIPNSTLTATADGSGGYRWFGEFPSGNYTATITGTAKGSFHASTKQRGQPVQAYPSAEVDKGRVAQLAFSDSGAPKPLKTGQTQELNPTAQNTPGSTGGPTGGSGSMGGVTTASPNFKVSHVTVFRKITNFKGDESQFISELKLARDGSKIAFISQKGVFTMNPDGSGIQQISDKPSQHLDISGNGRRIAWCDVSQAPQIFVANSDGSGKTPMPGGFSIVTLRLSADGNTVFLLCPEKGGLFSMPADGSDVKKLVTTEQVCKLLDIEPNGNHWRTFEVSADGSRIAMHLLWDIIAANGDGSNLHRLTKYKAYAVDKIAISPDGTRVAHQRSVTPENSGIVFTNFDGSGEVLHPKIAESTSGITFGNTNDRVFVGPGLRWYSIDGKTSCDYMDIGNTVFAAPIMLQFTDDMKHALMHRDGPESTNQGRSSQIVMVDFDPPTINGAPALADIRITPKFLTNDGSSTMTVTAKCSIPEPMWIGCTLSRDGAKMKDLGAWSYPLADAGANGDEKKEDQIFSSNTIVARSNSGKPLPPGPATLRFSAMDKDWNLTVIDVDGIELRAP
jgi:hypothetical protein